MLDFARHKLKNLALLFLSIALLPLDTAIISAISVYNRFIAGKPDHGELPKTLRKTVLITGVSMAKGLALARQFHHAGHKVIGADFHPLSMGRVSVAVEKLYPLPAPKETPFSSDDDIEDDPYALEILQIVKDEQVDLWISVSDVSAAIQDALTKGMIESQTAAKVVQLSSKYVRTLHDKSSFMNYIRRLELPTPDTEIVKSKAAAIDFLTKRGGLRYKSGSKKYLLKPIGVNDVARNGMPLLPLQTEQETLRCIGRTSFEDGEGYIMQEYLEGHEFCTHALVIHGRVRAFVACPSSGMLMHYQALPPTSPLSRFMLAFTETIAEAEGYDFTGHLSFDFMAKSWSGMDSKHEDVYVYPIECNPRVHTAVLLFNNTPEVVGEYLSILEPNIAQAMQTDEAVVTPKDPRKYYWIGQDLIQHFLSPTIEGQSNDPLDSNKGVEMVSFIERVHNWKDGTFETWDPWPWWWMYHVYWPVQFFGYFVYGRWHKINVSTGKAFQAS